MQNDLKTIAPGLFELNGKPSVGLAFPQAMQHVLAMLAGNITPPILLVAALGLDEASKVLLIQAAMIIGGITTLLQLYPVWKFGMGLPNVMGVAFAYMPVLLAIGINDGIEAVFGAQLIAAFASIFIGLGIGKIRRFFPPVVSGTVVLAIGLSLYGTALTYMVGGSNAAADMKGHPFFWIIAAVTLIVTLYCNFFGKGYVKVSGMIIGMGAGYLLALLLPLVMGSDPGAPHRIDFSAVTNASWIALPKILPFGMKFVPSAIISMIMMYIVQAVQTIGDVSSTAIGGFKREASDGEIGGAIMGQGICGMLGAVIGGLPTDPYSQNVGLIVTSKVIAKRVFLIVGLLMLLAGLCPVFGAIMTTIPQAVLGGATVTVFAAITMSGIQLITEQPMNYRNKMIVGIALALAVGVNGTAATSLQFAPQIVKDLIGSSPIVLAFLVAFILNIIVPEDNTPEED